MSEKYTAESKNLLPSWRLANMLEEAAQDNAKMKRKMDELDMQLRRAESTIASMVAATENKAKTYQLDKNRLKLYSEINNG